MLPTTQAFYQFKLSLLDANGQPSQVMLRVQNLMKRLRAECEPRGIDHKEFVRNLIEKDNKRLYEQDAASFKSLEISQLPD